MIGELFSRRECKLVGYILSNSMYIILIIIFQLI